MVLVHTYTDGDMLIDVKLKIQEKKINQHKENKLKIESYRSIKRLVGFVTLAHRNGNIYRILFEIWLKNNTSHSTHTWTIWTVWYIEGFFYYIERYTIYIFMEMGTCILLKIKCEKRRVCKTHAKGDNIYIYRYMHKKYT